jgi:zinc protease
MVNYEKFILPNGLKVIIHQDHSTPIAAVNLLYGAGARDEDPALTGFAHLFEHLMFEGSINIPEYDHSLQMAGGENNAFTNNDFTSYYLTIPKQNLETALWLESDRMLGLLFSEEKLRVQKNVVMEEFKESYLNQPYGDIWLLLRPLIYKVHPYQWATIGKNLDHIRNATLDQVKDFFSKYYCPNNAILVISGDVEINPSMQLVEKWFGEIPSGEPVERNYPVEPDQNKARLMVVEREVPFDEIYMTFHTGTRLDANFYATDLITDLLAGGQSSRLNERLVKKAKVFSEANAWISGSIDKGFIAVTGRLLKGENIESARDALWNEINDLCSRAPGDYEMQKVKNKLEASNVFAEAGILSKSINLSYYEFLGDANIINTHTRQYSLLTSEQITQTAKEIFHPEKLSELNYLASK